MIQIMKVAGVEGIAGIMVKGGETNSISSNKYLKWCLLKSLIKIIAQTNNNFITTAARPLFRCCRNETLVHAISICFVDLKNVNMFTCIIIRRFYDSVHCRYKNM